jgi:hypothetical protein
LDRENIRRQMSEPWLPSSGTELTCTEVLRRYPGAGIEVLPVDFTHQIEKTLENSQKTDKT